MTKLQKFIDASEGWDVTHTSTGAVFSRDHATDGFPFYVDLKVDPDTDMVTGAVINSDYGRGDGTEEHEIGSRLAYQTVLNLDNPFRYKVFLDAWLASEPESVAEKKLAERVSVSERVIRNARILGFMSGYLADRLCVKILKRNPSELYGYTAWVEYNDEKAWPKEKV